MVDLKPTVSLTNVNMETMSRKDYLEWVNNTVNGKYLKIEELCSGVAYCQMMEQLFPNVIGLKRIKTSPKVEYEFLHNLRLFQSAFTRLKFDKSVPIERLLKGKFQDNFEFLQWFKKFYDNTRCSNGKENCPNNIVSAKAKLGTKTGSQLSLNGRESAVHKERSVSPSSVQVLEESKDDLTHKIEAVGIERDFYFKKLTVIEKLLNETVENSGESDFCKKAFKVLYSVNNTSDTEPKPDLPDM